MIQFEHRDWISTISLKGEIMNENNEMGGEIAVVGGGIGGLVAALRLVEEGRHVTLYDRAPAAGGRAATQQKQGFFLNQGPHALYKHLAMHTFLTERGLLPSGKEPAISNGKALWHDKVYNLPGDPIALLTNDYFSVTEKVEVSLLLQKVMSFDPQSAAFTALNTVSVKQWIESETKSERIRAFFTAMIMLSSYSAAAEIQSAGRGLAQFKSAMGGVLYLDHGWQSMVQALRDRIHSLVASGQGGYREVFSARIDKIDVVQATGKRVVLSLHGQTEPHTYDAAIMAVPPAETSRLLADQLSPLQSQTLHSLVPARAACLDVCLSELPQKDMTFALGLDQNVYYSVHSASAELAPSGQAMIHLAVYLGPDDKEVAAHQYKDALYAVLDRLQPSWRDHLVQERYLPGMIAANAIHTVDLENSGGRAALREGVSGCVFISGDFTADDQMLVDAACRSALMACDKVLAGIKSVVL